MGLADHRSLLPPYPVMALETALVGLSQPFFQCTPPLLSATWFPPGERAMSSAVALNFNQVGIAVALVMGGWMVDKGGGTRMAIASMTATTTMPVPTLVGMGEIVIKSGIIASIPSSWM